jgi:hypothetical protein
VFTLQWLLTEKVKLPKYRKTVNKSSKNLRFTSAPTGGDENRANQTEALDRNNESTRYLGKDAQSPLIVTDGDEESPTPGSLKSNSLRQSIGSNQSARSKKNKYNPYQSQMGSMSRNDSVRTLKTANISNDSHDI